MSTLPPETVRRIEDAAAALIAAGNPNPTNEQVRQHLGGGSLSHISPVMRAFRARQREQADADIAQADRERDEALAKMTTLESELAVLREVVAERDRLLQDVRALRDEALPLREQVARLTAIGEHLTAQLKETKAELKGAREENRALQAELLTLAQAEPKGGKVTKGERIPKPV
ncbi:TPA: DNA-binding protein [Salmonella enterica subsp. enterica serovar Yopougon]